MNPMMSRCSKQQVITVASPGPGAAAQAQLIEAEVTADAGFPHEIGNAEM